MKVALILLAILAATFLWGTLGGETHTYNADPQNAAGYTDNYCWDQREGCP